MANSLNGKWKIRMVVVGVFLLGCLTGILGNHLVHAQFPRYFRDFRGDRFEQMLDRLKLNPEQRTQVEQVLRESRSQVIEIRRQTEPRFKEIRNQTDQKLQAILSPEQWQQWQQMTRAMGGRPGRGFGPPR